MEEKSTFLRGKAAAYGRFRPQERWNNAADEDDDEDGTTSSCSSNCTQSDGSSIAEWEDSVDSFGELLYIDCYPRQAVSPKSNQTLDNIQSMIERTATRRSTRGKFSRLMRRRESKRQSKKLSKPYSNTLSESSNKVTFQDCQEGEIREVVVDVTPQSRLKLGRRATPAECLLGLSVATFSDGERVMVAGFLPNGESMRHRNIKIGDWLKSIDDEVVTWRNLDQVLESLPAHAKVRLRLQRIAAVEVTAEPPSSSIQEKSELVRHLLGLQGDEHLMKVLHDQPIGLVYLATDALTETGPEFEEVLYSYPRPFRDNFLCSCRGAFVTLNHLFDEVTGSQPLATVVMRNGEPVHVLYCRNGSNLLLMALPESQCNSKEARKLFEAILRVLQFSYQTLDRCFVEQRFAKQMDGLLGNFFWGILNGGADFEGLSNLQGDPGASPRRFEDVLPASHWIPLPRDVQMQIDDALSELGACDYREWNEDPLDCQRLFTVIGSALYHSGYLICSHFPHGDLIDVHLFCRIQKLIQLSQTETIRSLVLWKEVFPDSCNRGMPDETAIYPLPTGRWFLMIVGKAQDMLAVIMEAGGCTMPAEEFTRPDAFYVEEVEATLQHVQEIGLMAFAEKWISLNCRPQVAVPESIASKTSKKTDLLGNVNFLKSSAKQTSSPISKRSILKRRSPDSSQNVTSSGSVFSVGEDYSEDSVSQGGMSERSEISDEPVLGRRAVREMETNVDFDSSDSDWEGERGNSRNSDSSDMRQTLLTEINDVAPSKLTAGDENVLFHYVQLDITEGILLAPPALNENSTVLNHILDNFRLHSMMIHNLLQNTTRFKKMLPQDLTKSAINKSLIAIKEHGMLFECTIKDDDAKKGNNTTYWVVGRLINNPHPRELYVCYEDSAPQNMIEIAFRLTMSSAG